MVVIYHLLKRNFYLTIPPPFFFFPFPHNLSFVFLFSKGNECTFILLLLYTRLLFLFYK